MKNKSNQQARKEIAPGKHVSWGEEDVRIIPHVLPSKKQLKKAILEGNLIRIESILNDIDKNEVMNLFSESAKSGEELLWLQRFFYVVHRNADETGNYDSHTFQNIIKQLINLDFTITTAGFYKMALRLQLGDKVNYFPQLRKDFQTLEKEFQNQGKFTEVVITSSANTYSNSTKAEDVIIADENNINDHNIEQKNSVNSSDTTSINKHCTLPSDQSENEAKDKQLVLCMDTEDKTVLLNPSLVSFYAWLEQLPEWLQEQILNSTPVKALIESAEQWSAMHDKKSTTNLFAKLLTGDIEDNSIDISEDNINSKATVEKISIESQIDTSMVLNNPEINGWIMPIMAPGFNDLFAGSGNVFNELPINFNGLNGIDLF